MTIYLISGYSANAFHVIQSLGHYIAINPGRAVCFCKNIETYLQFQSFVQTDMAQIVKSLFVKNKEPFIWPWNAFCITSPLWGESTHHWWFPSQRVSNTELWCSLCCQPELEQLERLPSEISAAAPQLPILLIHIRSEVKTRQGQSEFFLENCPKFKFCTTLYILHTLCCLIRYINMKWIQLEL